MHYVFHFWRVLYRLSFIKCTVYIVIHSNSNPVGYMSRFYNIDNEKHYSRVRNDS